MATEVKVPALGESVTEATVAQWFKKAGDQVTVDEPLVELETDKVTVEVPAPASGVLSEVLVESGTTVEIGAILAMIGEGSGKVSAKPAAKKEEPKKAEAPAPAAAPAPAPAAAKPAAAPAAAAAAQAPSVRRIAEENNLDASKIDGTGKDGRVTKGDALAAASAPAAAPAAPLAVRAPQDSVSKDGGPREERVKMTRLRKTIATRLKEAQNTAAMLTTFNEVDMSAIMALRNEYKAIFEKKHGVRVGFMGFFVKACIQALKEIPAVNGLIDGEDIVYKNYYNIGVAVGTEKGLVVPVLKDAQDLSLAGIEKEINDYGKRARDGQLKLEELQGGTFTISNGGVYGSLMSTPILNAPQSGVLGMHKIQDRPMVVGGQVVVRPMMYLALSYDHRIVDGKDAVTFLVRVKESLEDPQRLLLDL